MMWATRCRISCGGIHSEGVSIYHEAHFDLAPDDWLASLWMPWGDAIISALEQSLSSYQVRIPVVTRAGLSPEISDAGKGRVLPFTESGFQEFLTLARTSSRRSSRADSIAQWWWLRHLPRTFLSEKQSHRRGRCCIRSMNMARRKNRQTKALTVPASLTEGARSLAQMTAQYEADMMAASTQQAALEREERERAQRVTKLANSLDKLHQKMLAKETRSHRIAVDFGGGTIAQVWTEALELLCAPCGRVVT